MSYEVLEQGVDDLLINEGRIEELEGVMDRIDEDYKLYLKNQIMMTPALKRCARKNLKDMMKDIATIIPYADGLSNGSPLKTRLHNHMRYLRVEIDNPDESIQLSKEYTVVHEYYQRKKLGIDLKVFVGVDELNPFKKPNDWEQRSPSQRALFWVMRIVECALWPIHAVGWLVRNALQGFFFALRHPRFWEWGSVSDHDADLSPAQLFVKQVAKGFDNFFEINFEMLSRPLEVIELLFKFVVMDDKWKKIKEAIEAKFKNDRVTTITALLLFIAQIALSIALPVTLLGTAASITAGTVTTVRSVGQGLVVPGYAVCTAVASAPTIGVAATVSLSSPSFSPGENRSAAFNEKNPQTEVELLEQTIELLYKNFSHFSKEEDSDLRDEIRAEITTCEEKLKQLDPENYLKKREEHLAAIKKTIGLLRQNLTARLAAEDRRLFDEISLEVMKYEEEIKKHEIKPLMDASMAQSFVWTKATQSSSLDNRATMFSSQNSNNDEPSNETMKKNQASAPSMKKG